MSFVYSGLIFCDAKGITTEKSALYRIRKPLIDRTIQFSNSVLKIDVILRKSEESIIRLLYRESENNVLLWNCHHPKALAELTYKGIIYKGFGYAETLFSSIKPWNLPIDELRWGRYLSDTFTLIWICWAGTCPVNKMFLNGAEYNDAVFEDDLVIFGDGIYQLKFSEIKLIRKGKLSGLFSKIPLLKIFINSRFLNTLEIKYKAKTTFSKKSDFLSAGWSIFEVVTWEK
jgi:hypothetical protein